LKLSDETLQDFEENFITILMHGTEENIKTYLPEVLKTIEKYNYTDQFNSSIPAITFGLLKQYKKIGAEHFEFIENYLAETFKDYEPMIVPLHFLNIGIRHLKKKEKNV
ncbi:unnamed protein product, partial [marine sediment metagenome]